VKATALKLLLLVLIALEMYLLAAFLPDRWQVVMVQWLSRMEPRTFDHSVVTHPALDYEINEGVKKHPMMRVALDAAIAILAAANALLMAKLWKYLRGTGGRGVSRPSDRTPTI